MNTFLVKRYVEDERNADLGAPVNPEAMGAHTANAASMQTADDNLIFWSVFFRFFLNGVEEAEAA